jgi:two-component system copper resistance phosphate regulon response regulator CusR
MRHRRAPHLPFILPVEHRAMRILFAEDDPTLREFVARGLSEAGYAVDAMENGDDALVAVETVDYDLAILDVNLPGKDGFAICREIRARLHPGPAVLFLTARDAIEDRVAGLDLGAEDYLVKPFAFAELLARVRALLRRGPGTSPTLQIADLELDPAQHKVTRAGQEIKLTAKELSLLEYLMRNAGRVVTKPMIAEHVWNFDLEAESNFIEVYIYSLRKKLDRPGVLPIIHTVRGVGYRLDAPSA